MQVKGQNPKNFPKPGPEMGPIPSQDMYMQPSFAMYPAPLAPLPPSLMSNDTTLYVGNIHPDMHEAKLFELFIPFGKIMSCRIMKDVYTGISRGFGFVTFSKREEAEKAQKSLNGHETFKQDLRVMFKKNMKDLNEKANLILKNLDKSVTPAQIQAECQKVGKVVSCVVLRNDSATHDSVGYGYVQFENEKEANEFLENFNGKELCGKQVVVEHFIPTKQRAKAESKNLYLKCFPEKWNKERIEKFIKTDLGSIGPIGSIGINLDPKLQKHYAFVAFEKSEDAHAATEKFNNWKNEDFTEKDDPLFVGPAMSKRTRMKVLMNEKLRKKNDTNLYVRSLKSDVTKEKLKAVFEKYGPVTSVALRDWDIPSRDGQPTKLQFGFVNFKNSEDAYKALSSYKADAEVKDLVTLTEDQRQAAFVFFAQPRKVRDQYLRFSKHTQMYSNMMRRPMMMQGQRMPNPKNVPRPPVGFPQGIPQPPPAPMNRPLAMAQPQVPPSPPVPIDPKEKLMKKFDVLTNYVDICAAIRDNYTDFSELGKEAKKKVLGNVMFKRVKEVCKDSELLPKITGMLIDQDVLEVKEILEIIEDDNTLRERVNEAIDIIKNPDV